MADRRNLGPNLPFFPIVPPVHMLRDPAVEFLNQHPMGSLRTGRRSYSDEFFLDPAAPFDFPGPMYKHPATPGILGIEAIWPHENVEKER